MTMCVSKCGTEQLAVAGSTAATAMGNNNKIAGSLKPRILVNQDIQALRAEIYE